jgi:hypothetical protein
VAGTALAVRVPQLDKPQQLTACLRLDVNNPEVSGSGTSYIAISVWSFQLICEH